MIFRNLERRPVRSLLAIAGVAASVGLIVSGTFWWDAINYLVDTQFNAIERSDAVIGFVEPRGGRARFEVARLPGVLQAEPYRAVAVQLRNAQHTYRTVILGLNPSSALRRTLDDQQRIVSVPSQGMLLSNQLAERLSVSPGERVEVEALEGSRVRRDVMVAGVVKDLFGLFAYMNRSTLNDLMDEGDSMSAFDVRLDANRRAELFALIKATPSVASLQIKQNSLASFGKFRRATCSSSHPSSRSLRRPSQWASSITARESHSRNGPGNLRAFVYWDSPALRYQQFYLGSWRSRWVWVSRSACGSDTAWRLS